LPFFQFFDHHVKTLLFTICEERDVIFLFFRESSSTAPPVVCHEADVSQHNYIEDEGRPFEIVVQAKISNH
ncbi:hypothetical protein, partial [Leptospira noguchii]|uniref:hypothetical protein n=1 Tax=Leptospira noguchii TaxID=28182 RepID=UPI001F4411EA